MKKSILAASVMALMTLMATLCCFADVTGVADTSKEGSLLIWPLIQTDADSETYIVITNSAIDAVGERDDDNDDRLVNIKCFWEAREVPYNSMDGDGCPLNDAIFTLSEMNPIIFRASDGTNLEGYGVVPGIGKEKKGMLKCWAISPSDVNQIAWNHLSGYAIIVEPELPEPAPSPQPPKESAWKYSAWRFAANVILDDNGTQFAEGFWVGKTLDGNGNLPGNTMQLWGAWRLVTSTQTPVPTCNGSIPATECCPAGTKGIKMRRAVGTPDDVYTYYCIQKVNGDKCPWPYAVNSCYQTRGVYDACPSYLIFEFLAERTTGLEDGVASNYLALAPCKEDLRGDDDALGQANFRTRLSFSIWNRNEVKYTGSYSCANCNGPPGSTYDVYLSEVKAGSMNYFQEKYLHTNSGRFRVEGLAGGKCGSEAKKTPLVGIMASRLLNPDSRDIVATGGTSAGAQINTLNGNDKNTNPAWIRWDPSTEVPVEERKRR